MTLQTARLISIVGTLGVCATFLRWREKQRNSWRGRVSYPELPYPSCSVVIGKSVVYVVPRDTQWTTKRFSPAMTSIGSVAHEASRGRSSWLFSSPRYDYKRHESKPAVVVTWIHSSVDGLKRMTSNDTYLMNLNTYRYLPYY